jgi:poly(A) polymerase
MGLWRKQTAQPQEAEQFDIRGIVNEFKISVLAYVHRREGMDIIVSHVKRKDIPLFVFPGRVRPPRSSRTAGRNSRAVSRNDATADVQVGNPVGTESWSDPLSAQDRSGGYQSTSLLASSISGGETPKIMNGHLDHHTDIVEHEHPGQFPGSTSALGDNAVLDVVTQANSMPSTSSNGGPTNGLDICFNSSHKEFEGIRGNNLVSSPAVIDELDELVLYQAKPDNKHAPVHGSSLEGCSEKILGQTCDLSSHGNNHLKRKAEEELEVYIFFNSFHMYLGFLLWP